VSTELDINVFVTITVSIPLDLLVDV